MAESLPTEFELFNFEDNADTPSAWSIAPWKEDSEGMKLVGAELVNELDAEVEHLRKALNDIAYRSVAPDDLPWCRRIAEIALMRRSAREYVEVKAELRKNNQLAKEAREKSR